MREYWSVDVHCSERALGRVMLALVSVGGRMLDSTIVGSVVLLQIDLPVGAECRFRESAKPLRMVAPSAVDCGWESGAGEYSGALGREQWKSRSS